MLHYWRNVSTAFPKQTDTSLLPSTNTSRLFCLAVFAGFLLGLTGERTEAQNNNTTIQVQPLPQISQPRPVPKNPPRPVPVRPPDLPQVIGVISGPHGSATLQMTSELAQIVSPKKELRILPLVGDSQQQNLNDIFWLKGVDLAIIQSDTLSWAKSSKKFGKLMSKLRYISELSSSEIHVLAHRDINHISELEGKKVNMGVGGTPAAITAERLFKTLKIQVDPVFLSLQAAVYQIERKKLAATVFISGKPAPGLTHLGRAGNLKLLNIDYTDEFSPDFTPEIISHEDYPELISKQEAVSTIAVRNVLMVYNWSAANPRYRKVAKFVDVLFSSLAELRTDAFHPKWQEISPTFNIEGFRRFKSAQDWLKKNRSGFASASASAKLKSSFEGFLESQGAGTTDMLTKQERELLFNKFVRWKKQSKNSQDSK